MIAPRPLRWHALMLAAGLVYLILELAFNARLVDVAGGLPDPQAVADLEVVGRSLSAVGFVLVLFDWRATVPCAGPGKPPCSLPGLP